MPTPQPDRSTLDHPSNGAPGCHCPWPRDGLYAFAGHVEPITILGLAGDDEVRILDEDGAFRTVPQHRVTVIDPRDLS